MLDLNNITKRLSILTSSLILLSIFTALTNTLIIWLVFILIVSLIILSKKWNDLRKIDIFTGILLSGIVTFSNIFMGILVLPAYLACTVILRNSNQSIKLFHVISKLELNYTIFCIVVAGGLLSCLNVLLSASEYAIRFSFQASFITDALMAGISEEILFRMFLYALCIEITKGVSLNMFQEILCYSSMVIPHVLLHFTGSIDITSVLILSFCFGLPFSLMQRKINLLSAIGAHSLVDLIRFIVLGI